MYNIFVDYLYYLKHTLILIDISYVFIIFGNLLLLVILMNSLFYIL